MWLDNLKELKKKANVSNKQIAEGTHLPERTINRIYSGETKNPYIDTLDRIAHYFGVTLRDILVDANLVVGTENLATLQENVDVAKAEKDLISVENDMLKKKVDALTTELELLKKELTHNEELLALHNYYKTHIEQLIKERGNY